jgi:hypothetical protein
MCETI